MSVHMKSEAENFGHGVMIRSQLVIHGLHKGKKGGVEKGWKVFKVRDLVW